MDSKRLGIIESDIPSINLPNCNSWTYILPFFKKWSHLTHLTCGQTFKSYTYRQVYEASLRWANELQHYFDGENPPVVSVISPNFVEYPILYLGSLAAGAPICPVRHDYEGDVIFKMLEETKTNVIIVHPPLLKTLRKIFSKLDREVKVYVIGTTPMNSGESDVFDVLFSDGKMMDEEKAKQVDPESVAVITFSSGTTGIPKAILIPQKSLSNNAVCTIHPSLFALETARESFQDVVMLTLTLAHSYGLSFTTVISVASGCQIIICDPFDFSAMLKVLEKCKPRVMKLNPYIIDNLCRRTDLGNLFDSVKILVNVGSGHNPITFKELNEKTTKRMFLQECYGSSEMGGVIYTPIGLLDCPGVSGKLMPNTKARLLDISTGEPVLEPHKKGELLFYAPCLMKGYLNRPEETKEVLVDGEWFRTGDIGYYDQDNLFYVIDRVKDIMPVKGKRVFPSHVESILKSHKSVLDAGVICAPNANSGEEELRAFVISDGQVEESDLIAFMKENAPPEMWLEGGVTFVDSLPRNGLGKMIRKHLRTLAWAKTGSKVY